MEKYGKMMMNGDDIHHETCFFVSFNDDICDQTMKHCFLV